jgi:hypothetical protein
MDQPRDFKTQCDLKVSGWQIGSNIHKQLKMPHETISLMENIEVFNNNPSSLRTYLLQHIILNFKVLGKQLFSIHFPLASCFMQISFHFFAKFVRQI